MKAYALANNARTTVATEAAPSDTSIVLAAATAPFLFPSSSVSAARPGILTLTDNLFLPTKFEIISYTGVSTNTLTGVTRGIEGTTAQTWPLGSHVYQAPTADQLTFAAHMASLNALSLTSNQGVYLASADTFAAFNLTSAGRSLIDDATVGDMRTTLELGALAVLGSVNNANWSGTPLAIANGGTGGTTPDEVKINIELQSLKSEAGELKYQAQKILTVGDVYYATYALTAVNTISTEELILSDGTPETIAQSSSVSLSSGVINVPPGRYRIDVNAIVGTDGSIEPYDIYIHSTAPTDGLRFTVRTHHGHDPCSVSAVVNCSAASGNTIKVFSRFTLMGESHTFQPGTHVTVQRIA